MKAKVITSTLIGVMIGIGLLSLAIWKMAPSVMMVENQSKLGFEETVQAIKENAAKQHWVIPGVKRLDKSLEKDGHKVLPVAIIELCKPELAVKILSKNDERIVSSMMPCRVSVYKKNNGDVIISRMNTAMMSKLFGGLITEVMQDATAQTEQIFAPLEK